VRSRTVDIEVHGAAGDAVRGKCPLLARAKDADGAVRHDAHDWNYGSHVISHLLSIGVSDCRALRGFGSIKLTPRTEIGGDLSSMDGYVVGGFGLADGEWQLCGRTLQLDGAYGNGRFRRISPVPVRPGEGTLTEPTPAVQPSRRELVLMPQATIRSPRGIGAVECSCDGSPADYRTKITLPPDIGLLEINLKLSQ
jgi:hypothetical protein